MIKLFRSFCGSHFCTLKALLVSSVSVLFLSACNSNDLDQCLKDDTCGPAIEVFRISGDLPIDPTDPLWNSPNAPRQVKVELEPQMITNPKWPNPSIRFVNVSAARNDTELAIALEWEDATKDKSFGVSAMYLDMAAVMFPLQSQGGPPAITMGNDGNMVNIWQWKDVQANGNIMGFKNKSDAQRLSDPGIEDLNAEGFSTLTTQDHQDVTGKGIWVDNKWKLVLKRNLRTNDENDVQFEKSSLMAVAVWNGSNKERNGQKGLEGWLLLNCFICS
jgi:DMSO reductase family type II enzyme heme b subunit